MIAYLDSSAAAKLLTKETDEPALSRYLNERIEIKDFVVSSTLLETELRRTANRENLPQTTVTALLDRLDIFDLTRSTFTEAGVLPGDHLRSLDALHIAAALRINADVLVSYDQRQKDAAGAVGLRVHSPS